MVVAFFLVSVRNFNDPLLNSPQKYGRSSSPIATAQFEPSDKGIKFIFNGFERSS